MILLNNKRKTVITYKLRSNFNLVVVLLTKEIICEQHSLRNGKIVNITKPYSFIENICDPCGNGGPSKCSFGCMDFDYFDRVSLFYPSLDDENQRTNFDDCPGFWRNYKVKIEPLDLLRV